MTLPQVTVVAIAAVVVAIVAIALAIWTLQEVRKIRRLRTKFGPEYDRTLLREGDADHAAKILEARERRVAKYQIRSLTPPEIDRFTSEWRVVQEHFVDNPRQAVTEADELIDDAMRARGYPTRDFEARAADLSVDYPTVVENYRAAHSIRPQQSRIDTEQLREAMHRYRALFEQLIGANSLNQVREAD